MLHTARGTSGLDEAFGQRLRAARLAALGGKGLGQAKLAEALGISQATVSDYERGRRRPPLGMLVRLADFLGVSAGWLLTASLEQPGEKPAVLQRSLADLLGLTTLTWLGTARLCEPATAPAGAGNEWPGPPDRRLKEGIRAAEDPVAYGPIAGRPAGEALVVADVLCPGARYALVYTGPPYEDLAPGDILFTDPALLDPGRWRLVLASGGDPGTDASYTVVPAGTGFPAGSEPRGTVVGLLRRSR